MKKTISILILIFVLFNSYSQNLDLIVTTGGDSIACRIDSITAINIYFEMKHNNNWVHTQIEKSEITEYKYKAIDKKLVIFKPGTSYIKSITDPIKVSNSMYDIRRNSVYNELLGNGHFSGSVNYDRLFSPKESWGH